MKCSKTINQLSGSERKRLMNEIQKANGEFLEEQCQKMKVRITNNLFKIIIVAANESCGLGAKRIERILLRLNELVQESETDEVFFPHIENNCKQILGFEIYSKYFTDEKFDLRSNEQ